MAEDALLKDLRRRMDGAIEVLRKEFGGLRTGRASASLLEPVMVEAYGNKMPLNQVANVNVPEPRMIMVQVWDRGMVKAVDKAIREAGLGLNPQTEGQTIRVPIPDLNEERRRELTRVAAKYAEAGARRGAQRAARRHRDAEQAGKGQRDLAGRAAQAARRTSRPDRRPRSSASTRRWRRRTRKSFRSDESAASPRRGPLPRHVAIIMDGNGRWAKPRGLPRIAGHRRGAEAVRRTVDAAAELGIPYLTLFGFSSENWKRPSREVDDLMGLLRHYLRGEIAELHRNGVRLRVIGDRGRLAPDIVTLIDNAER